MPRKSLPPDARSFADLYARGGVAHEAGDLTAAVELYSQALLRSRGVPPGDRAECLANRGRALSGLGERSRSMRDYRAALALAGDFHEIRARLANDLLLAGSRSAARPHILELLRHCPDWGETHRLHGDWLFLSESTRAAHTAYQRAVRLDPGSLDALRDLATASYHLGWHEVALRRFELVLQQHPDPNLHFSRLLALAALDRRSEAQREAIAFLGLVGEEHPYAPYAALHLGRVLGDPWPAPVARVLACRATPEEAIAAARTRRQRAEAHLYLGLWWGQAARPGDAVRSFRASLRLDARLMESPIARTWLQRLTQPT